MLDSEATQKPRKHLYQHIETIWNYMKMGHTPAQSDLIFVLCSNDLRVASHAAALYHQGYAPKILFSGGSGRFTDGLFDKTEAETFAAIARDSGVPAEAIYLETEATNTGENITLGYEVINKERLSHQRLLLVQKPFMERRSYATFMKQWPASCEQVLVTSSSEDFVDYISAEMPLDMVLTAMMEDYHRIKHYPAKGFQIEQAIPNQVEDSYEYLVKHYLALR
ncbi:YdcF family protein [uncultured Vibrio sp.]|uniref:YdcF family protein n=1 Tax=uncultured Vibrio sp. TaxID=114054 RepID=UPI0025EC7CD9|nr:YdcF family protein [uncultured Vibrio sp.]